MNSLIFLDEILTNSFNSIALNIVSLFSILLGILVIVCRNPVVSVLFLIGLFLTVASYLMILGINFIGLSYLLVYVGAVSILFLFILMLINVRVSELVVSNSNSIPLAIMTAIFFNISLTNVFPNRFSVELDVNKLYYTEINTINSNILRILNNFYLLFNNSLSFVTSQV